MPPGEKLMKFKSTIQCYGKHYNEPYVSNLWKVCGSNCFLDFFFLFETNKSLVDHLIDALCDGGV